MDEEKTTPTQWHWQLTVILKENLIVSSANLLPNEWKSSWCPSLSLLSTGNHIPFYSSLYFCCRTFSTNMPCLFKLFQQCLSIGSVVKTLPSNKSGCEFTEVVELRAGCTAIDGWMCLFMPLLWARLEERTGSSLGVWGKRFRAEYVAAIAPYRYHRIK